MRLSSHQAIGLVTFIVLLRSAERLLSSPAAPKQAVVKLIPTTMSLRETRATQLWPVRTPRSELASSPPRLLPQPQRAVKAFSRPAVESIMYQAKNAELLRPFYKEELPSIWLQNMRRWPAMYANETKRARWLLALRNCSGGCGANGMCNMHMGICQCSSGWIGKRCQHSKLWHCNAADGRYLWSRCAGECDTRYGYCVCGSRGAYPDRPLLQCEPRGIERVITPWKLDPRNQAERYPWDSIWGRPKSPGVRPGWCDANASIGEQPAVHCACRYDGRDGYLCQHHVAMFCLNQCSFHGECRHGFCVCSAGWWGIDCSIPFHGEAHDTAVSGAAAAFVSPQAFELERFGALWSVPRKRPLIFVYEMPQRFTTDLLQRRHDKMFCVHRTYLKANRTQYAYGIYQGYVLEVLLHEWLLSSAHRTTDPAQADWFYVPVYATCAIVTAIFDTPQSKQTTFRTALASELYLAAYEHIRAAYPYWNASGGADHIWTFGYDEGGCFAPAAIWGSLIISHWGNTMSKHNRCTTTYEADRWDAPYDPRTMMPLSSLTGGHPCYDGGKDIVMPSFRELTTFLPPSTGLAASKRRNIFFFSGDLGSPKGARNAGPHVSPRYSLGIRQAIYHAASADGSHDIEVIGHIPNDWWNVQYHAHLRNATFCGAFPGDGWSGGISSAIFAGCIPMIVMDGIELPFENVLNYEAFAIRVAEADIPSFPSILRAISPARISALQAGLARVRSRFGYGSIAHNELRMARSVAPWTTPEYLSVLASENEQHEDALQTMMRILLHRADTRDQGRIRIGGTGSGGA